MTERKEKTRICKSVVIATDVAKNGFHCTFLRAIKNSNLSVCLNLFCVFIATFLVTVIHHSKIPPLKTPLHHPSNNYNIIRPRSTKRST